MFHSRDGFYFERLYDGSVLIRYAPPLAVDSSAGETTLPENEWASVMATVSARGETAATWQEARDYHAAESGNDGTDIVPLYDANLNPINRDTA